MILLDSNILIDASRNHDSALHYLESIRQIRCFISVITVTEVLAGVRKKGERELFDEMFDDYKVLEINFEVAELAGEYVRRFRASHNVNTTDALIAATAHTRGLTLITRNAKHFPMLGGGVESPY